MTYTFVLDNVCFYFFICFANFQIFPGNIDDDSLVTNMLDCPVIARYIRILPQGWINHIAMRFDVLGCQAVTGIFFLFFTQSENFHSI